MKSVCDDRASNLLGAVEKLEPENSDIFSATSSSYHLLFGELIQVPTAVQPNASQSGIAT
jgi:hypothetical protein